MGYGSKSELTAALGVQVKAMDDIVNVVEVDGENVFVSEEKAAAFDAAHQKAEEIREHLRKIDGLAEAKAYLSDPEHRSVAQEVAAGMQDVFGRSEKSLGQMFTESDEFKALVKSGRQTMDTPWVLNESDLGAYVGGTKDLHTRSAPTRTTLGFGRTQFDPIVPRAQRTQRVRDLFPVASTSANLIDFFRVIGFGSNRLDLTSGARPVAERTAADGVSAGNAVYGLKPQSSLKFEAASAAVRTIAHFETAHRNVLADEPQLQSLINNELMYGLRLEEDKQILLGSGTGEDLLGLLNTPNLQGYTQANTAGTPDETKADALRRAATKAALAYYEPSGYVMHPYDFEDIELTKTSEGAYVIATNVQVGAQRQAWRQPVVESPMMPQGTFVTGAWGLGAQLYDREQANIRIAEQHADFFIRNAIVVLAEQRLAFAVKRPESFVKGAFVGN